MNMPVPPLGIDSRDPQQCMALVAALPLTRPARVQESLTTLLQGLAVAPPPAASYLQILEMTRPAMAFVQESSPRAMPAGRWCPAAARTTASIASYACGI